MDHLLVTQWPTQKMRRRIVQQVAQAAFSSRTFSSTAKKANFPTDQHIIQAFRRGDYDTAISSFAKRPARLRSPPLYEAAVIACAQIPDAAAAQAVLNVMKPPTQSAVTAVITAWCRERNVSAAADVLQTAANSGLQLDPSVVVYVSRVAHRFKRLDVVSRLNNLKFSAGATQPCNTSSLNTSSFFVQDEDPEAETETSPQHTQSSPSTKRDTEPYSAISIFTRDTNLMRDAASAERQIQRAAPDADRVYNEWLSISEDDSLRREVGVLSAAVSTLASCPGQKGGPLAVNTLMTWVRAELYNPSTQRGAIGYTERPNVMALLLTSATSALAAAAPTEPRLALSAYDALNSLQLPGFSRSLPLTGAYLKVLQHAQLSLSVTQDRINQAWGQHIQFDEQAFSMALGALLKSRAPVAEKLEVARDWVSTAMRAAGIPLTVHTYNLLAGQVRYAGDARLVSDLLSDMRDADVQPTAVTYGLIFGVCIMRGEYTQRDRRKALPVQLWNRVLNGMRDHMTRAGVEHTAYSRLSLAMSYAHLGEAALAMEEFDSFIHLTTNKGLPLDTEQAGESDFAVSHKEKANDSATDLRNENSSSDVQLDYRFGNAFYHVMYHLAHARECSSDCTDAILLLCEKMRAHGMTPRAPALDALSVACVRAGQMTDIAQLVGDWAPSTSSGRDGTVNNTNMSAKGMSITGMKHLLKAIGYLPDAQAWYETGLREIMLSQNSDLLSSNELTSALRAVVLQFARVGHRDVCEDIVNTTGVSIPDLKDVYDGREFLALRSEIKRPAGDVQRFGAQNIEHRELSLTRDKVSASKRKECSSTGSVSRSRVVDPNVVPLT